jgi:hypothetical protein
MHRKACAATAAVTDALRIAEKQVVAVRKAHRAAEVVKVLIELELEAFYAGLRSSKKTRSS